MSAPELLIVVGTRPEAIKLAPVIRAFTERDMRHRLLIMLSGQHEDLLEGTSIVQDADIRLSALPRDLVLEEARDLLAERFQEAFRFHREKGLAHVLVQGDTSSSYCAARVAQELGMHVHHVEAGLRTGDLTDPYPEEFHRCAIRGFAGTHYAPTPGAKANLLREGVAEEHIHLTGNTVIDELLHLDVTSEPACRNTVLITMHRYENRVHVQGLLRSANRLAGLHPELTFLWARHPNPAIRTSLNELTHECTGIRIVEPLHHQDLVSLYHRCALVMTDSGGIQEEAAHLGIPLIVLRTRTERQEVLSAHHGVLCPPDQQEALEQAFGELLGRERCPNAAFGDGKAAERIVDHLVSVLDSACPHA